MERSKIQNIPPELLQKHNIPSEKVKTAIENIDTIKKKISTLTPSELEKIKNNIGEENIPIILEIIKTIK